MRINQTFEDKAFNAIIFLFLIKILYILFNINNYTPGRFFGEIIGAIVVFMILLLIAGKFSEESSFGGSSNSSVLLQESIFDKIQRQYRELAEKYEKEKNYKQASYIYLRLLKDHYSAAQVLERGQMYHEAAAVYLKYSKDKYKAAECYEKARAYKEAIKLYAELDEIEKVGDIFLLLNDRKEANKHYFKVIEDYKETSQYVKASLVYKDKINDTAEAQNLLLDGWKSDKDAYNCLNNYFGNIKNTDDLKQEIASIYQNETPDEKQESFLQLMKIEFKKDSGLEDLTKDIAYEIIASKIDLKPDISSELVYFNKANKSISKDIMKFKLHKKRKE